LRILLGVLSISSIAALLGAQDQVIRVNTRLVEVDVVVRNKNGPVADLTKDDFTVFDQGKPQKISSFTVVSSLKAHQQPTVPLRPGEVSNRVNSQGQEPTGTTAILLDALNTSPPDQAVGRQEVMKYLSKAPKGEQLGLFAVGQKLHVVTDFTDDPEVLKKIVSENAPEPGKDQAAEAMAAELQAAISDSGDPITNALASNSIKEFQDQAIRNRVEMTGEALMAIAKHMQGVPGRKKLIWISASFPAAVRDVRSHNGRPTTEYMEFSRDIQKAVRALNDANVAIYPIDPRDPFNAGLLAPGIDTMNLLAVGTGGEAFYNLSDIAGAIKSAVEDSEVTYALGFYPSDVKFDGEYHSLSVKVDRKGLDVRHRKGYLAAEQNGPSEQKSTKSLKDMFANPLAANTLGLTAIGQRAPSGAYELEVKLNFSELHVEKEKDQYVALINLATELPAKRPPNGTLESIKITLTEARLRDVLTNGFILRRPVPVGDETGDLRVVVQDRATGAAGSVKLHVGASRDN
jgi:VWFA-related protein